MVPKPLPYRILHHADFPFIEVLRNEKAELSVWLAKRTENWKPANPARIA